MIEAYAGVSQGLGIVAKAHGGIAVLLDTQTRRRIAIRMTGIQLTPYELATQICGVVTKQGGNAQVCKTMRP